jgi:hypothetical protein
MDMCVNKAGRPSRGSMVVAILSRTYAYSEPASIDKGRVRTHLDGFFNPIPNQNSELDDGSGSHDSPNFWLDSGPVLCGSGSNLNSEPNYGSTTFSHRSDVLRCMFSALARL